MFKKIGLLIVILVLAACSSQPSQPTTRVNVTTSGTITQDEIWRSEIHITGDIQMANGATLTIEPGTTVFIASNSDDRQQGDGFDDEYTRSHNDPIRLTEWSQNAILINGLNGVIHAVGTPEQPINFLPEGNRSSPAQWDGILFERGTLQYAKVLYGGRTAVIIMGNSDGVEIAYNEVRYFLWAGIDSHTSNVWIHNNIVEGGGHQGIGVRQNTIAENNIVIKASTGIGVEQGNNADIRNNIIIDCAKGIELRDGEYINVTNNTIAWVNGPPNGWYYQGTLIYPAFQNGGGIENHLQSSGITILNNIVYGPFDFGIGLHQQPGEGSVVDYNMLWGQSTPYGGGAQSAAGIHNFVRDPLFVDPSNGDFSLRSSSPAIDVGDPEILDADGSLSDLGAFGGPHGVGK